MNIQYEVEYELSLYSLHAARMDRLQRNLLFYQSCSSRHTDAYCKAINALHKHMKHHVTKSCRMLKYEQGE